MTQSNTYDYSKEETNFTYRRRTSAIGVRIQIWYRPQIPCPLPGNTSQERTAFKCGSRTETGCIHSVCIQLDETICVRRYIGTEDKARPGSQANNGLLGRGIGQRCCITGTNCERYEKFREIRRRYAGREYRIPEHSCLCRRYTTVRRTLVRCKLKSENRNNQRTLLLI